MTEPLPSAPDADPEAFALLFQCLRFDAGSEMADKLRTGIAALGWDRFVAYAEELRLGSVLFAAVERLRLAPPIPPITLPDGRMTITKALAQRAADHVERRRILADRLAEIAAALNAEGIVPVALKGGRSIVTGAPAWRHLRDLDLLVPPRHAVAAQRIVLGLGYRPSGTARPRLVHHHFHELFRDDLPGWIEIHRRGGPSRVEQFIPSSELLATAEIVTGPTGARLGVLPAHLHVLHGIIHHHIGHRAVKQNMMHPKGLYEFAAGVMDMAAPERAALLARAARHPRLLAILELWTAAAADLFGMPASPPIVAAPDAERWWQDMRAAGGDQTPGTGPELRAATDPDRLRRAHGGESALRRAYWRLTMPLTFIKRPVAPTLGNRS